jgi:molybdopterin synthase sulfurtransferase
MKAYPVERATFVYPAWLYNQLIRTAQNPPDFQVIQVGDGEPDQYRLGHIPGAIYLDTSAFECAPSWNVIPDDQLEQALLAHGIRSEKLVVLYGRDRLAVSRAALVLLYAGVRAVRVLWGGVAAWSNAGYLLETGAKPLIPVAAFGRQLPAHPEYIVDMQQVRALLAERDGLLACVRSWDEYIGRISGYDYILPRGRIPGSVWAALPGDEAYRDRHSPDPAGTASLCQEIEAIWREQGLVPHKKIVFYCGTGWRASEAFLYAYWMGWKNITVYDGGWLEWSAEADNPIEVGEPG